METSLMEKMENIVIYAFLPLLLIMIFSDDPLMIFCSILTISIIVTVLISLGCARFSRKHNHKYYKKTIIVSSGIIGSLSFCTGLIDNLYFSYAYHFIHPEFLCYPVMLALTNMGISISIQMINRRKKYINPETYGYEVAEGVINPGDVVLKLSDIDNEIINMRHVSRILFTAQSHYENSDDPIGSFSSVADGSEVYKIFYKDALAGYVIVNADIISEYHILREKYDDVYLHILKTAFDRIMENNEINRIGVEASQRESMEIVINSYNNSKYTYLNENDRLYALI